MATKPKRKPYAERHHNPKYKHVRGPGRTAAQRESEATQAARRRKEYQKRQFPHVNEALAPIYARRKFVANQNKSKGRMS